MHVAHAAWGPDRRLHVWAEDAAAYADAPERRARRRGEHPFAAATFEVPTVSGEAWPFEATGELELALPSAGGRPLPSPAVSARSSAAAERDAAAIARWTVPAAAQDPHAILAIALALPVRPAPELGASLRFFARTSLLALELLARGRFLPVVDRTKLAWRHAPGAGDLGRFATLAGAMPRVCLAARPDLSEDGRGPMLVLDELLAQLASALVRDAAAELEVPRTASSALRAILSGAGLAAARLEPTGRALAAWSTAVAPPAGPFRTVLRLREPGRPDPAATAATDAGGAATAGEDGNSLATAPAPPSSAVLDAPPQAAWRLEVLAGARDDPSLLVPAADVWSDPAAPGTAALRAVAGADPEETLLVDLARAARLYPLLEDVLQRPVPGDLDLDTDAAHGFLRDGAPLLADAGYTVLLPAWWMQRRRRIGLRLHVRPSRPRPGRTSVEPSLGADALVDYDWRVAVGDIPLTEAELAALARSKGGLVWLRGEWVELGAGDVEAALAAVREAGQAGGRPKLTVADVLRAALGITPGPRDLEITGVDAEGWLAPLLSGHGSLAADAIDTPPGFEGELRPYQQRGLGWLASLDRLGFGGILADDMGLGKTAQLLALLLVEQSNVPREERLGPTLVVCPMSLVGNWQREAGRFAPGLRVHVHHGADRLAGPDLHAVVTGADLVITTYALAARDRVALAAVDWGRVVLDEAQEIKNSDTDQSRAARGLRAPSRFALTGTPVENRLSELWTIMDFCNPGLLGTESAFVNRFAIPIERFRDDAAAERLRRAVSPFILRRVKTDPAIVPELPPKLEFAVSCNLTREQATLYQAVVDELMPDIERAADAEAYRGKVLRAILRLKQVCNHPAQFLGDGSPLIGRSGKLERLEEVLDTVVERGERALVFTQFTEWAERLVPYLRDRFGREVLYLHGAVARRSRDAMVERFGGGSVPIFVLSLKAGGKGLNLVAANHVIHYDRWWNPAVEDQASDRAYRIGQTREVEVRTFVATGTVEEKIADMLAAKRDLAARIVRAGDRSFTELSPAELREILALSSDAVVED